MSVLFKSEYSRGVSLGVAVTVLALALPVAGHFLFAGDRYDLDHWKLNARVPVSFMWMNLGFW